MSSILGLLTGLGIGLVGLLAIRRPAWAAGIIVVMFSIEQLMQSFFPIFVAHSYLINVSIGLMGVFAALLRYLRGEDVMTGYMNPILLLVVGLYVYQIFGLAWSPGRDVAIGAMKKNFTYITLYVLIAPMLVRDLKEFDAMMRFLLVFGTIVLLLILFNPRAEMMGARYRLEVGELGENAGNPLATGRAGGTIAIAAILLRSTTRSTLFNMLRVVAFITGMAMAILSGSRGQSFGAALVIILMYPLARKVADVKQFFFVAGGFMVVAGAVFLVFDLFISDQNVGRYTEGVNVALESRWDRVSIMLEEFVQQPERWLIGLGPGGFSSITGLSYTHNVPTEVLVELGLIGATMFVAMLLLITRHWRRMHKALGDEPDLRAAAAVVMGIFLFNFILSCKQGTIIGAPGPMLYFILIGRVAYTYAFTRRVAVEDDVEYYLPSELGDEPDEWDAEAAEPVDYSEYGDFSDYGQGEPEPAT